LRRHGVNFNCAKLPVQDTIAKLNEVMTVGSPVENPQITLLLARVHEGDQQALADVARLLHSELRRLAAAGLSGQPPGHTWQPTDLVNELWTRLLGRNVLRFQNRAHFLGAAAHLMRAMIVDHARSRGALKRRPCDGNLAEMLPGPMDERYAEYLAMDKALNRLARMSARQAQIVEMRHFGGLTVEETARAIGISAKTVKREWAAAGAWLHGELCRRPN